MSGVLLLALVQEVPTDARPTDIPMTVEERDAVQSYLACYHREVGMADDGIADPLTLARSVAPNCRGLLGVAADVVARSRQANRERIYAGWIAFEDEQGVRIVQVEREDKKTAPSTAALPQASRTPKHAVKADTGPIKSATATAKPMSEWRRAYIAKHGHQPPAPRIN